MPVESCHVADLPTGTVSFLFTDIEGSTLLLQQLGEAYRGLLYSMVGSIKSGALMQYDRPRFMRVVDWTSKSGLDNPDNNYYVALLRDDEDYRITSAASISQST